MFETENIPNRKIRKSQLISLSCLISGYSMTFCNTTTSRSISNHQKFYHLYRSIAQTKTSISMNCRISRISFGAREICLWKAFMTRICMKRSEIARQDLSVLKAVWRRFHNFSMEYSGSGKRDLANVPFELSIRGWGTFNHSLFLSLVGRWAEYVTVRQIWNKVRKQCINLMYFYSVFLVDK